MTQSTYNSEVQVALSEALHILRKRKPDKQGELARRYAVAITELEKVIGYFDTFVVRVEHWPE